MGYQGKHRSPDRPIRPAVPLTMWVTTACMAVAGLALLLAVPEPAEYHPQAPSVVDTFQGGKP